ncbi:MAG TPA: hypothetical protein VGB77_21240 [Abditibacteriaceae bacterium]
MLGAAVLSMMFLWLDAFIVFSPNASFWDDKGSVPSSFFTKTMWILAVTCIQIILLLPFWRFWMLKKWISGLILFVTMISATGLFFLLAVGGFSWAGFISMTVTTILSLLICFEWPRLKPGFYT